MSIDRQPFSSREQTFDAYAAHVSRGKAALYRDLGLDLVLGERQGAWLADAYSEHRWLNCHCNGGVFNLGHRHPRIHQALTDALAHLDIGNHHLVSGWRARLASRLSRTTDGALPVVVFGVGGGESIDLAIKLARGVTARSRILSAVGGFHGHTGLALAAGDGAYRDPFGPNLPDFEQVPFDDLAALERALDERTAAVLLEPIPATLGMPIPADSYFPEVARLCRERGAKLIVDEVQTGLGRTGRLWCCQHWDVVPDVLVTGKGLSGGYYPIAATIMTAEMHQPLDEHPFAHISTFGGAELGCAVATAVLDVVEERGFLDRVTQLSDRIAAGCASLPCRLRRKGLMMGLEFPMPGGGLVAAKALLDQGVLAAWANNDTRILQLLPPLVLSDDEADELVRRLQRAFG